MASARGFSLMGYRFDLKKTVISLFDYHFFAIGTTAVR